MQWYLQGSCEQLELLLQHKRTYCEWVVLMACRLFPVSHQVCWWPSRVSLLWVTVDRCVWDTACTPICQWMFCKTRWTRFWRFKFNWCRRRGTGFTYPAIVDWKQDWISYLGIITQASCCGFIEFKYRNTFAALAKYKFSLMFPDVTENLHSIYRACALTCVDVSVAPLFFFITCQKGRELRHVAVIRCFSPDVSDGKCSESWGYTECWLHTWNTRILIMGLIWFTYWMN